MTAAPHKAELRLWKGAGIDPSEAFGTWYRETGSGMGATLNTGTGMGAYVMTDRATWIAFGNKGTHQILVEGDAKMFKPVWCHSGEPRSTSARQG